MLDARVMTELVLAMEHAGGVWASGTSEPGLALSRWDDAFIDTLLRLVRLSDGPADATVLGEGRVGKQ